jgi:hypothetical protein
MSQVVEVNFSSRRPKKEVIQRVEEAVLSHRLESSSNCLLLFKDIDLIDNEEDEGFYAAVAQLITTAVRPIVMTTSKHLYSALDSKIEKKDPLRIAFEYPKSAQLVKKVLMPIIASEMGEDVLSDEGLKSKLQRILQSISLHGRCDIRQVINQTQLLFACKRPVTSETVHRHSIQQDGLLDLGFTRGSKKYRSREDSSNENGMDVENEEEDDKLCLTLKARKKRQLAELDRMAELLGSLGDLDCVNGLNLSRDRKSSFDEDESLLKNDIQFLKSNYFDTTFCSMLNGVPLGTKRIISELAFASEEEVMKAERVYKLGDEVGEYFDSPYGEGAWESAAWLRTIVKRNMMDSVGRLAKRNGRLTCYFNRLDRGFMNRVCMSFDYDKELEVARELTKDWPS